MGKKLFSMLLLVAFIAGGLSLVQAADKGNWRKGKYLFRKNCRSCHTEKGKGGELSPSSKTQAQWTRAFLPENIAEYDCKDQWAKISAKDKMDIFSYLYRHAADSPTPAKCK